MYTGVNLRVILYIGWLISDRRIYTVYIGKSDIVGEDWHNIGVDGGSSKIFMAS